ncbi:MAG: DUF3147 family protein [Chloroflexi bacterium]|nr:DUF3147 family protein [Chloroflexota bacterium]
MLVELLIRFIAGGLVVCAFAVIGDILQPKSFGGIFGAAPSVALATLGLTFAAHGGSYVGLEGRSMVAGAVALLVYSLLAAWLLWNRKGNTLVTAGAVILAWLAVAIGIWGVALR